MQQAAARGPLGSPQALGEGEDPRGFSMTLWVGREEAESESQSMLSQVRAAQVRITLI